MKYLSIAVILSLVLNVALCLFLTYQSKEVRQLRYERTQQEELIIELLMKKPEETRKEKTSCLYELQI